MQPLQHAFLYLLAAVIAVPIAKRLGLGSVLGYLLAGVAIGPGMELVTGSETDAVQHFAEFGVVMMLFLVGLELQPRMLWRMRGRLLGLGGLQVGITTAVGMGVALALGTRWQTALVLGMTLSLSSTAIVLQTLGERGWLKGTGGRSAFSVLLFQDIAVIPMIAILPLLVLGDVRGEGTPATTAHADAGHAGGGVLDELPGAVQAPLILLIMGGIVFAGRVAMRPALRVIASARLREVFTAAALLLVVGVALLMHWIGLSPALGTFLAGVVLSDSEYRHELESDIEPFKGLLLGLFFISVGAGIEFDLLLREPGTILGLAVGSMVLKFAVLMAVGRTLGLRRTDRWLVALGLCQTGEFGFVLLSQAQDTVVPAPIVQRMMLVVAITMLLTPFLFIAYDRLVAPRLKGVEERPADAIDEKGSVVLAGSGRFGSIIARLLMAHGYRVVVLDHNPDLVEVFRRLGIRTYYGDASRPDLLHAAGIDEAQLFVAALGDREMQTQLVHHVVSHHPHCRVLARAIDRHHVYELQKAGAHVVERETFEAGLAAARKALVELGVHPFTAERHARAFRDHDVAVLDELREMWHAEGVSDRYIDAARTRIESARNALLRDRMMDRHDGSERGWTPPPKTDDRA